MSQTNPFSTEPLSDDDLLAEDDEACSKTPEGRAVPPWLRDERRWRVFPLARGKATLFPPRRSQFIDEYVGEEHLAGSGFRHPMVVLGPAGAGLTTFHRWARMWAQRAGAELVELDFARIAQSDDPEMQRGALATSWCGSLRLDPGQSDDLAGLVEELLLPGRTDAPSDKRLRTHILLHVDRFHPANKEIFLGRLRQMVENRILQGVRFVVLAHETAPLEDTEPFSSFLAVCEVFRLADFSDSDVEAMWRAWVPDQARHSEEVAEKCVEWTGGQPVLANLFMGQLRDEARTSRRIGARLMDEIGSWLVEHPPRDVLHWQAELARLVLESTFLRRKISSYLAGEVRVSVSRDELPLFLAGWIGQDRDGNWKIRSKAHARWAEGPLRSPERFVRSKGGGR